MRYFVVLAVVAGLVHCASPSDAPHARDAAPDVDDGGDRGTFDSGQFAVPDASPPDPMPDVRVDVVPAPC